MKELLKEFAKLNIPDGQYAIYGSGPLAIREIRDARDLDVAVKDRFYADMVNMHPEKEKGKIELSGGKIEIYPAWNSLMDNAEEAIDRAELIRGFRFVKLEDIIEWKQKMGRDKDKRDIELIKKYHDLRE